MFVTNGLEETIYMGDRMLALRANPGPGRSSLARVVDVLLPRPRNQLATKELPDFLRLRRELYGFLGHGDD